MPSLTFVMTASKYSQDLNKYISFNKKVVFTSDVFNLLRLAQALYRELHTAYFPLECNALTRKLQA